MTVTEQTSEQPPLKKRSHGAKWFFGLENPLWTVIPIIVSLMALFFAYRSMTISKATSDVHLRVNEFCVTAYTVASWMYEKDGYIYYPGIYGDAKVLLDEYVDNQINSWSNKLSQQWMAPLNGYTPENILTQSNTYSQYFHYLMITNDSNQNAWRCTMTFNHYAPGDLYELRGRDFIPQGAITEVWSCGPTSIAPGKTLIIPMGTSYMRYDETITGVNDYFVNMDVQYFGDSYEPVKITYESSVSGLLETEIDRNSLDPISYFFTTPPLGPLGDELRRLINGEPMWYDEQGLTIIDRVAPQPVKDARSGY
jgi:hypothetical protein